MEAPERALRSKLTQIVSGQGIIRGTLLDRRRRYGSAGCHGAKGPGHPALYLILSDRQRKRQRQLYIPREWHDRVRQWVDNHRQVRELIHEISKLHWNQIKRRPDQPALPPTRMSHSSPRKRDVRRLVVWRT